MSGDEETPQSFSWVRRWSAALNLLISVAAVLALAAMFNYLSIRHFTRFHWNHTTEAALSERTRYVLAALTNTVKVTVYWDSSDKDLYPRVKGLIKEYQFASPRIQVQYVDYTRDVAAAEKVKQDYKLPPGKKDIIIFESNGSSALANGSELSDYDYSELLSGKSKEVYRTHFKGELLFTSRIYSVATGRRTIAYYLFENGEPPDIGEGLDGYGKFFAMLRNENNFDVRPLRLVGTNEVPADCNLLIIAGPTTPLATVELDRIQHYLAQGGRALIAFNRATVYAHRPIGLEKLLSSYWGVEVGENVVIDQEHSLSAGGWDLMPVDLGPHPIMNALRGLRVVLQAPRSIRALRGTRTEDSKVDELLFTGEKTVVMPDPSRNEIDPTQSGPKSLMAVVEKTVPAVQRGSTRIVVMGDSTVWGNNFLTSDANRELGAATVNWLVNQSVLLNGIPPRALHNYKITMTQSQLQTVQLVLLAGMPGAVLLIGLLVWLRRRH